MTQEEMLTALYEKMAAEQDKYRDWLKGQPRPRQRRSWLLHRRWPMFTRTLRSWKPATWM